jgi:LAGLIDADG endonuclease
LVTHHNTNISKLNLCYDPLLNNAWLAGFIDADGNFSLDVRLKTQIKKITCLQLNQRMIHPKTSLSYQSVLSLIADLLCVNLNTIKEKASGRDYYLVKATSAKSKKKLRVYLDHYPLLTSKFLDYTNWCLVDDLMLQKQHYIQVTEIIKLKNSMNNSRTEFNWAHLDDLL